MCIDKELWGGGRLIAMRYKKSESILNVRKTDDYILSTDDFFRIASFYLLFPLNDKTCIRSRTLLDYGWNQSRISDALKNELLGVSDYFSNVVTTVNDEIINQKNLRCDSNDLLHGEKGAVEIGRTDTNLFYSILHHIRNCLAHGNYRFAMNDEDKYVLFEDHTTNAGSQSITARLVLKLSTLMGWINVVSNKH